MQRIFIEHWRGLSTRHWELCLVFLHISLYTIVYHYKRETFDADCKWLVFEKVGTMKVNKLERIICSGFKMTLIKLVGHLFFLNCSGLALVNLRLNLTWL